MASDEELYILLENEEHRKGKSNLLNGQADLLKALKSLKRLRILSRQKSDLKIELLRLFENISKKVELIEKEFPNPKVPKKLRMKDSEEKNSNVDYSKMESIDSELESIREKLRMLNA